MTKAGAAERSVKVEDLLPQQPLRVAAEELTDAALTESTDDGAVTFSVWTALIHVVCSRQVCSSMCQCTAQTLQQSV